MEPNGPPNLFNQTMYETFFSSIGILMGFLQAIIFQFALDKPKSETDGQIARKTRKFLIIIQEALLLSFFHALIYIYFFGTYIPRNAIPESEGFLWLIRNSVGIFNLIVLICIAAIFVYNLLLFNNSFCNEHQGWRNVCILIITIFCILLLLSIIFAGGTTDFPVFTEKVIVEPLIIGN